MSCNDYSERIHKVQYTCTYMDTHLWTWRDTSNFAVRLKVLCRSEAILILLWKKDTQRYRNSFIYSQKQRGHETRRAANGTSTRAKKLCLTSPISKLMTQAWTLALIVCMQIPYVFKTTLTLVYMYMYPAWQEFIYPVRWFILFSQTSAVRLSAVGR